MSMRRVAFLAESLIPPTVIESLGSAYLDQSFTPRQETVLRYLYDGYSNQRIAQEMICSEGLVKHTLRDIYAKLNVKKRTEVVLRICCAKMCEDYGVGLRSSDSSTAQRRQKTPPA